MSNKTIKKAEWQTGVGFFSTPSLETTQYLATGDSINRTAFTRHIQGKLRSFDFTNRLLFETSTIRNTFKLFAGPTVSLSIIPSFRMSATNTKVSHVPGNQEFEKEDGFSSEMAKFSYSFGALAEIKFSLSCRWNLGIAYQYHWRQIIIKQGNKSYSRNGFNVSLRYKFVRPDENGNPPDNINNGPFW